MRERRDAGRQRLAQQLEPACELRAHRRVGPRECVGDFLRRQLMQNVQHQHLPVRLWQRTHCGHDRRGQLPCRSFGDRIGDDIGAGCLARPLAQLPPRMQRAMHEDAAEPWRNRAACRERARLFDRHHERLLHEVLGGVAVAEQMKAEAIQIRRRRVEHAPQCQRITRAGVPGECAV